MDGYSALDAMIAQCRALKGLGVEVAKEAAPAVQAAVRETAAAGTDPDGNAWVPKKDGSKALANVAKNISAVARGAIIQVVLSGGAVWHHNSKGKKKRPQRRVIPDSGGGIPKNVEDALTRAAARVFARMTGGR